MSLAALLLAALVTVPPGEPVVNHAQPYQYAQPTIRRFERRFEDEARQRNWESYCAELDDLWTTYRRAASTPRAWQAYVDGAEQAKRRYVFNDPYLAPIINRPRREEAR